METALEGRGMKQGKENRTAREKRQSLGWAIGLSTFLTLLKAAGGIFCSSTALLASALDSFMDVGMSSVNYLAVSKGAKPADEDHAYGHEKIESLASYTQGLVILFLAFLIFTESLRRTLAGNLVFHSGVALVTIAAAALINFFLTGILSRAEKKTGSLILKAEKAHYLTDIYSYLALFVALILVQFTGWAGWDLVGGILVAGYVAFLASRILKHAGDELVDRSLPKSVLDELDSLIRNHPHVLDYHELRTRKVGTKTFLDFHLVMNPQLSFSEAHEITESLIQRVKSRFKEADVTIHEDPEGGI